MARPRRRTLQVFISSPGDCAAERAMMERVVRTVSESGEAQAAGLRLEPVLFKDLPPGQGAPGNVQLRINEMLERYDLHRYEIYAGMMKHRLGTPTAKYRSGTIEELETAIAGNRKSRVPAEVLFYFIDPENAPDEVVAFREQLSARGYLSGNVKTADELEMQFTTHLTRIVMEWRLWRNRIRRGVRRARPAVAIAAILLAIALSILYVRFDRGGAQRVDRAFATRAPAEALAVYEREQPYLVVHRRSTRRKVRERIAKKIRDGTLADSSGRPAAALWQRAQRAGVWSGGEEESRRLLRDIAARRTIEALLEDGIAVAEWPQLRAFERAAVRAFASAAAGSPALAQWPRDERNAVCVVAEAWPRLAEFAGEDEAAKELLVRHAPAELVARWIGERVTPQTDADAIVLAAEQRRDPAIIAALLDRVPAAAIADALESVDATAFAPYASRHLQRADLTAELRPLLLAMAPAVSLSAEELQALVRPVLDGTATSDYEIAVYRAIAARKEWRARGFLMRRYDHYSRDSLAIAQKAALIDAMAAADMAGFPEKALALAKTAPHWGLQAAYLRALARNTATWPRHAAYVRRLLVRRIEDGSELRDFEPAVVDLMGKLTAPQIVALLALPPGIVDDLQWEPRWYILRALGESQSGAGEAVADAVFARMPVNDETRALIARTMARSAPEAARTVLATQYVRDPGGNAGYLPVLADANAEAFFRERIAAGDANVLAAASRLPDESRCKVFALAVQRFGRSHAPQLWSDAARCEIDHGSLIGAAVREVREGAPDAAAMRYLAAVGREQIVIGDAARLLRAAKAYEWFALADALPARSCREPRIESLLETRALLRVDGGDADTLTAGGRTLFNPLLRRYAEREDAATARKLLEWSRPSRPVQTLGEAGDAPALYRAYCLWLAAPAARHLTPDVLDADFDVTPLLAEHNPLLVRAAAAVCLGATSGS